MMEKFVLTGKNEDILYRISLPAAKYFEPFTADDLKLLHRQSQKSSIKELVELESEMKVLATNPSSMFNGHNLFHKLTLKNCLSKHSYPVAQGPAVPPLDDPYSKDKAFADRTEYVHTNQKCFEWLPAKIGLDIFGETIEFDINSKKELDAVFEVEKSPELKNIKGAASLRDMSIVYTCKLQNCIVHCPCTVCMKKKGDCRGTCKQFSCQKCSTQCIQHEAVGLARQFDPIKDHLTIVTDKLKFYRHAIPYPGIPLSCELCTNDVHEHQILHHVFHLRCKFCRLEARPYEYLRNSSLGEFKEVICFLQNKDQKTCSFCFSLLGDKNKRKNHENRIHLNIESKYKCKTCDKSYMNKSDLEYHMEKHEKEAVKFSCNDCGKQYKSQQSLSMHKETVHEKKCIPELPCHHCDLVFSTKRNLNRHMRTVHEDPIKINVDFLPPGKEVPKFQCSDCDAVFNRKDNLKRHIKNIHDMLQGFSCNLCSRKFKTQDVLNKHIESRHK